MGRKKKKAADKRIESIRVMLTAAEKLEIERTAAAIGSDVGAFVRSLVLESIRKKAAKS